jgi:hypothetical protein
MANRITDKHLKGMIDRLNRITNNPLVPYERIDGKLVAQIGCYHLSHAYGGVSLYRMCNEGGGVTDVFHSGHTTKRELYERIYAYIKGIEDYGMQS